MSRKRKAESQDRGRNLTAPYHQDSSDGSVEMLLALPKYNKPVSESVRQELIESAIPSRSRKSRDLVPLGTPAKSASPVHDHDNDSDVVFVSSRVKPTDIGASASDDESSPGVEYQTEYEQAKVALAGPKKRGRKVGSGAFEQRKKKTEYSTNKNTMKARRRRQKMNPMEQDIERAKAASESWVSKRLGVWKKTPEFQAIPLDQQPAMIKAKREELRQQRQTQFSGTSAQAVAQNILARWGHALQQEADLQDNIIAQQLRREGVVDDDEEDNPWWTPQDFDDAEEIEYWDGFGDVTGAQDDQHELGQVDPERHFSQRDPLEDAAWKGFRSSILQAVASLEGKLALLRWIGPIFRDEVVQQGLPLKINPKLMNPRWKLLQQRNLHTPSKFFTTLERKVLQALWGASEDKWVTLPGPTHWWPDSAGAQATEDNHWYSETCFDIPPYPRAAYVKAKKIILSSKRPPKDWMKFLAHPSGDIVWMDSDKL